MVRMTKGVGRGKIPIGSDFSRKPNLKHVGVYLVTAGFLIAMGRTSAHMQDLSQNTQKLRTEGVTAVHATEYTTTATFTD